MNIPAITTNQMREVDRLMVEVYGIELMQMMENAGRHLAELARRRFLAGNPKGKSVLVLAGTGGNGGGGLVAARRLQGWGANVIVYITKPEIEYQGIPARQLQILKNLSIPIEQVNNTTKLHAADLIIDAIIGYGLFSAPRDRAAMLIRLANQHDVPILSLDVPSGFDATMGEIFDPHIQATATLTLALPKTGLQVDESKSSVGELFLADISVPPQLYAELGLKVGYIFSQNEIIQL
jgi:NAD(P)H-hydrate epimerase